MTPVFSNSRPTTMDTSSYSVSPNDFHKSAKKLTAHQVNSNLILRCDMQVFNHESRKWQKKQCRFDGANLVWLGKDRVFARNGNELVMSASASDRFYDNGYPPLDSPMLSTPMDQFEYMTAQPGQWIKAADFCPDFQALRIARVRKISLLTRKKRFFANAAASTKRSPLDNIIVLQTDMDSNIICKFEPVDFQAWLFVLVTAVGRNSSSAAAAERSSSTFDSVDIDEDLDDVLSDCASAKSAHRNVRKSLSLHTAKLEPEARSVLKQLSLNKSRTTAPEVVVEVPWTSDMPGGFKLVETGADIRTAPVLTKRISSSIRSSPFSSPEMSTKASWPPVDTPVLNKRVVSFDGHESDSSLRHLSGPSTPTELELPLFRPKSSDEDSLAESHKKRSVLKRAFSKNKSPEIVNVDSSIYRQLSRHGIVGKVATLPRSQMAQSAQLNKALVDDDLAHLYQDLLERLNNV